MVSGDRQQGAGTSGKTEILIRIRDTSDTGRPTPDPKLLTRVDASGMLLSRWSLVSLRCFAPIDPTADVPVGQRPVLVPASGAGLPLFGPIAPGMIRAGYQVPVNFALFAC